MAVLVFDFDTAPVSGAIDILDLDGIVQAAISGEKNGLGGGVDGGQ